MSGTSPIGIFDSGIGGLTVANAIKNYLPNEQIIYFGDTAHLPYGDKSPESIVEYSERIAQFLIEKGCKIIVIACNSASSIAFDKVVQLAQPIPVINVIDPVVDAVTEDEGIESIGVIGTRATINSGEYSRRLLKKKGSLKVSCMATPLLVPLIEEHIMGEKVGKLVIAEYLSQETLHHIDTLILGCTHYPLVKNLVEEFYQGKTKVVDSADIVGRHVKYYLKEKNLLSDQQSDRHYFYVSEYTDSFEKNTRGFFGEAIELEEVKLWRSLKPGAV